MEVYSDEYFMTRALDLAMQAYEEQEVPIGAVVVHNNKIIGKGYNQTEKLQDVTAHAEMLAITAASNAVNGKYLDECTLYVTIEPCLMCAGAIQWSRFSRIVFGASEPKFGFERIDKRSDDNNSDDAIENYKRSKEELRKELERKQKDRSYRM